MTVLLEYIVILALLARTIFDAWKIMLAGAIVYFMEITMLYVAFNSITTCTHAGMQILSFTFLISNFSFLHMYITA